MIQPINGKNQLASGNDPVPDTDFWSLSTSISIAEYGILGDVLAFLIQLPAFSRNLWKALFQSVKFIYLFTYLFIYLLLEYR